MRCSPLLSVIGSLPLVVISINAPALSQARNYGQRAGAEQIACVQITAVDRVVRHHVHEAPVRIAVIATGQVAIVPVLAWRRFALHVQRDVNAAVRARWTSPNTAVAEGGRSGDPMHLGKNGARASERHDHGDTLVAKFFIKMGQEWLVFPCLDIARTNR